MSHSHTDDSPPLAQVILKRFEQPDEVREMEKGRFELVRIGGLTIGRALYEPGWRWSDHVGPALGQRRCHVGHVGLVLAGQATAGHTTAHTSLAPPTMPCNGLGAEPAPASRGVVRARVTTFIRAPRDRVAGLFLDYARWPRLFPATIAGVKLVQRDASSLTVVVEHRREGRVLNELHLCEQGVVELREYKRRFDATFVNRFDDAPAGTRYTIDAEVRVKRPYAPLAPLLGGIVRRALRRYTMEPLRIAAERDQERPHS